MDINWELLKIFLSNKRKTNALYKTFCNSILTKMSFYEVEVNGNYILLNKRWNLIKHYITSKQTDKNRTTMSNIILQEMRLIETLGDDYE